MDKRYANALQWHFPTGNSQRNPPELSNDVEGMTDVSRPDLQGDVLQEKLGGFLRNNCLVISIVLVGILLRTMFLDRESFWIDEAMTGLRSRWDYFYMVDFVASHDQMPLYFSFTWLVARLFGSSATVLRGLSVIFGVIAFIPVYKIGRIFSKRTALLSLLIFSLNPTMIYYSQEARPYMLIVLLSASSMYLYMRFLHPGKMKKRTAGILMAICNVMLIYVHYFGALFVGLQLISMFSTLLYRSRRSGEGSRLKENIIRCWPLLISLMAFTPWLLYQKVEYTISDKVSGGSLGLGMGLVPETFRFIGGQYTAALNYDTDPALITGYIILFAFLFSVMVLLIKRNKQPEMVSFLFLGIPLLLLSPFITLLISYGFTPMYNHRYLIFISVPCFVLVSMVLSQTGHALRNKNIFGTPIAIIMAMLLLAPSIFTDIDQLTRRDKPDWRGGIDLIMAHMEPGDIVLPFPDYEQNLIFFYTDDLPMELMGNIQDIEGFLKTHQRVWLIFSDGEPIDDQPLVLRMKDRHVEEFGTEMVSIRLYIGQSPI